MTLLATFPDPIAGTQQAFRRLLKAMSEPGAMVSLPALPAWGRASCAATVVLMTLVDGETPIFLDEALSDDDLLSNLRFHTGAPLAAAASAATALLHHGSAINLTRFAHGDDLAPEKSATVIIDLAALHGGQPLLLSGPGIEDSRRVAPLLPESVLRYLLQRPHRFPQGIDLILTSGENLMALPRTTNVEVC